MYSNGEFRGSYVCVGSFGRVFVGWCDRAFVFICYCW